MAEYVDHIDPPYTNRWKTRPGPNYRRCQGTTKAGLQCRAAAMWNSNCCAAHHIGPLWEADYSEIEARVLAHLVTNEMIVTDMKRDYVRNFVAGDCKGTVLVVTTELGDVPVRAIVNDLSETGKEAAAYALASVSTLLRYRERHIVNMHEEMQRLKKKAKKRKRK